MTGFDLIHSDLETGKIPLTETVVRIPSPK
jgi:hypothetical protein